MNSRQLLSRLALPVALGAFCLRATACPSQLDWAKWIWNEIEWTYSGNLPPGDIQAASDSWSNSQVASKITIEPTCYLLDQGDPCFSDIQMSDNENLDSDVLAETDQITDQSADTYCYDTYNSLGVCLNSSVAFYVTMEFHPSAIVSDADFWAVTYDWDVQVTAAHELGHVLDLDDDSGYSCSAPSIMSYSEEYPAKCDFMGPQQCDVSGVLGAYSGWTTYSWVPGTCSGSCS